MFKSVEFVLAVAQEHISEIIYLCVATFICAAVQIVMHKHVFLPLALEVLPKTNKSKPFIAGKDYSKQGNPDQMMVSKFQASAWKFFSYVVLCLYGMYALYDEQYWLWNPQKYHEPWIGGVPSKIKTYYLMETAYYLFSAVYIFYEPYLADRNQMFIHHLVTISLLVSSYLNGSIRHGCAILLLHDLADPFMEAAKLFFYTKFNMAANASFIAFASVFIILRDWIYPRYIVWTVYQYPPSVDLLKSGITTTLADGTKFKMSTYEPIVTCLLSLCLLHYFWTSLIIRMVFRRIITQNVEGDIRENS